MTTKHHTGIQGVFRTRYGTFAAKIYHHGKSWHLGSFDTAEQAGTVYQKAKAYLNTGEKHQHPGAKRRNIGLARLMHEFPKPADKSNQLEIPLTSQVEPTSNTIKLTLELNGRTIVLQEIKIDPQKWGDQKGAPIPPNITASQASPPRKAKLSTTER